jgi:hypothetical protein
MPFALQEANRRVDAFRQDNPTLADMAPRQIADLYRRSTGRDDLDNISNAGAITQTSARFFNTLQNFGQTTERGMLDVFGDSRASQVAARAASLGIAQAPEILGTLLVSRLFPQKAIASVATGAGVLGGAGLRAFTETGEKDKALGSILANAGSIAGSVAGFGLGKKYLSRHIGKLGGPVAGFFGGIPGDAIDEAVVDGAEGLANFFDPTNLMAYTLLNAVTDTAGSIAYSRGGKAAVDAEANLKIAEATKESLDLSTRSEDLIKKHDMVDNPFLNPAAKKTIMDMVKSGAFTPSQGQIMLLRTLPQSEQTESVQQMIRDAQAQRKEELAMQEHRIKELIKQGQSSVETVPEKQATIHKQLEWLEQGNRRVVMIPDGSVLPSIYDDSSPDTKFPKLETDNATFVYDPTKISPEEILAAQKEGTLGNVLDYGIPNKPEGASMVVVIRDKDGLELQAVVTDEEHAIEVIRRSDKLARAEDGEHVVLETPQQVIAGRKLEIKIDKKGTRTEQGPKKFKTIIQPPPPPASARQSLNYYEQIALVRGEDLDIRAEDFAEFAVGTLTQGKPRDYEIAVAARFLDSLLKVKNPHTIKAVAQYSKSESSKVLGEQVGGLFHPATGEVAVRVGPVNEAGAKRIPFGDKPNTYQGVLGMAAHELSHAGMWDYIKKNPEGFREYSTWLDHLGNTGRRAILADIAKLTKFQAEDLDYKLDYSSQIDPFHKNLSVEHKRYHDAWEFTAGITEMLLQAEMRQAHSIDNVMQHFKWMPPYIVQIMQSVVARIVKFFESNNGAAQWLSPKQATNVRAAIRTLGDKVFTEADAYRRAYELLKNVDRFDPELTLPRSAYGMFDQVTIPENVPGPASPIRDEGKKIIANTKTPLEKMSRMQYFWMSGLAKARLYPAFRPIFEKLHHVRTDVKEIEMSYMAWLGQYLDPNLTRVQGIEEFMKWKDKLASAFAPKSSRSQLVNIGKAAAENQRRRDLEEFEAGDLVTEQELVDDFHLSPENAKMTMRLFELPQLIAQQDLNFKIARDELSLAKLLFAVNKKQDMETVHEKAKQFTLLGHQMGVFLLESEGFQKQLKQAEAKTSTPEVEALKVELQNHLELRQSKLNELKLLSEATLRQVFAGDIDFAADLGQDAFINLVNNAIAKLGFGRAHSVHTMMKPGYLPQYRRGNYIVTVYEKDENGESKVKETKGFTKKKDADIFVKKTEDAGGDVQLFDKTQFKHRVDMVNPRAIKEMQQKVMNDFAQLAEQARIDVIDHPSKSAIIDVINDMQVSFRPLESEYTEVVGVKGDPSLERRKNIEGFESDDYLPNLIEYMSTKTVAGQRSYTRAYANYFFQHPDFDADPQLSNNVSSLIDYVLNHSAEARTLRTSIFNMYLGASVRHMVQNSVQPFLTGIPQLTADGAGGLAAYKHFAKSYIKLSRFAMEGTTGDKTLDALLAQAHDSGITTPNAIEFVLPSSEELSDKVQLANEFLGHDGVAAKGKEAARNTMKLTSRVLRSSSVIVETINRRASFMAAYEFHKGNGIKDPQKLYELASQFTDNVNFVGDKSNRPGFQASLKDTPWAHSTIMVLTALQSFTISQASQFITFWKEGRYGSRDVVTGERRNDAGLLNFKNPATVALWQALGHLWLVAGVLGTLGAEVIDEMLEKATGISLSDLIRKGIVGAFKLDENDKNAGSFFADLVLKGAPTAMGVDATSALGLGSPVNVRAGRDVTGFDLIGPLGGIIQNTLNAGDQLKNDPLDWANWQLALRQSGPQTMKHMFKTYDAMFAGDFLDRSGKPINTDPLGAAGQIATLAGFTPRSISMQREASFLANNRIKSMEDKDSYIVDSIGRDLAEFQKSQNPAKLQRARKAFVDHIDDQEGRQNVSSFIDSIQKSVARQDHPILRNLNFKQVAEVEKVLAAYPSAEFQPQGSVDAMLGGIQVSLMLGQVQEVQRRLKTLQRGLPEKAVIDSMSRAGVRPVYSRLLLGNDRSDQNRLQELLLRQDPYLAELLGTQ